MGFLLDVRLETLETVENHYEPFLHIRVDHQ